MFSDLDLNLVLAVSGQCEALTHLCNHTELSILEVIIRVETSLNRHCAPQGNHIFCILGKWSSYPL